MTFATTPNENPVQCAIRLAKARIALHGRCRGPVARQGGQICIARALGFADNCGDDVGACGTMPLYPNGNGRAARKAVHLIAAETFTRWDDRYVYPLDDDHFAGDFDEIHMEALGDLTWLTESDSEVFDVLDGAYARAGLLPTQDGADV
jgi:hypothetical protein